MSDIIRVLRVIEYVGERSEVERTLERSIKGRYIVTDKLVINAATVDPFPKLPENKGDNYHE